MGLDMYLYREQYFSGYDYNGNDPSVYRDILTVSGLKGCEQSPSVLVKSCVAYWRKANSIHKWFCDLDGGRDECQPIDVRVSQLRELRALADTVLLQPAIARDLLPTQSGFFFGPTEYDEWYMEDMKNTVTQLDEALADIPIDASDWDYRFIYQASW
jgi:hypothetical protein